MVYWGVYRDEEKKLQTTISYILHEQASGRLPSRFALPA